MCDLREHIMHSMITQYLFSIFPVFLEQRWAKAHRADEQVTITITSNCRYVDSKKVFEASRVSCNYEMRREGLCHKVVNLRQLHGHLLKGISVSFAQVTHKQMI